MANCKVCLAAIKKNQLKVQCHDCSQEFHGKCVNISQPDLEYLTEQGTVWRCDPCNRTRRKSMRLEFSEQGLTLETIMNTLKEIREEQKNNIADFNRSYEVLYNKMEENTVLVRDGMGKIDQYIKEIEQLKGENDVLRRQVASLESRIDDMENYSRRNCLEIQGIPEQAEENVSNLVVQVGRALNVDINEGMIDACHRVGKKATERSHPRGIIVKFVRRTDKEVLMNRRRERKRDFTTRHLGLAMDNPVYLNDSLSQARRKLLATARQVRKDRGYKYIWLRNGSILLRKEEKAPVIEIRTQADLREL